MSASSPPPPPPQPLPSGGGAPVTLFLDTDLGTHLALNVAADSTIRGLKTQVAVEHATAFPDLGTVSVKSFQVLRKGAMYHLSDSMVVRSAFAKVKAGYFLHVKMAAAEAGTHHCRDEDRGKSSDKLPPVLEGGEDPAVNVSAHDVHPSFSSQRNIERNSTAVCLAIDGPTISVPAIDNSEKQHRDQTEGVYVDSTSVANINGLTNQSNVTLSGKEVHAREEDLLHSVGDREQGFDSGDKQMGTREEILGELDALDDLSQEKDRKKARVAGSFDTSAVDPIRETNDSTTRDVETNTNSRGMLSNTSFQQEVDGNVKEDSVQLENPIIPEKNKKRKKSKLVTSKDVSAREMTEPSTGAVEQSKAIGDAASNVKMTSRDKTKVIPADMLLSPSELNSGSQVTKHVQLGTDAQAASDLAADQSNIGLSTCKVVPGEEKSAEGTNDGDRDESAIDASNTEKGKSKDVLEALDNISQEKNCKKSKKASSLGLTSMDTAEAKDQCGYGEKAGKSDIISTQQEIVNDPDKRQIASNLKQGHFNVTENPNDVKRKKKRRHRPESSNDDPTQDAANSSGFFMNNSTQDTSTCCLDAKQITLGNIGEETADEKDQCRREKVAEPVIVSTQGASVNDPSNVQQGNSDVRKNSNGDGKRKKKQKRHLESSKDDPTQDVTKPSGLITPGTIGEATVGDCRKVDGTVDVATTNVINEVLADLRCTNNLSTVLDGDLSMEQSKGGASESLPSSAIQSDPRISSPSHKSKSTVLDPSHSSGGLPDEKISDVKDVLTENTVVPANGRSKSTKRQRNKLSLKHVPTDSGKAIQALGEQVRHVPAEDFKGDNCTKAELFQGASAVGAPAGTGQIVQKKSKRSSKTQPRKIEEVNNSTHGHENQFANDSQNKHVTDIDGTHNIEKTAGAPTESPVVHKDDTSVTHDKPNARKGRKKSSTIELQSQDTNVEHDSDANFMNSRAQQGAVIPEGSSDAVEPNDYVAVHPGNDKINFLDHFSPIATNDPSDSTKNIDETIREVKGKKKSKRKADTQSQHAGSIEPNDLPESDVHRDKTSLADHFGTGNVSVPSVIAENMNKEYGNVKKTKGKKKSKTKLDLLKPESLNLMGGNQETDNCTHDLMPSDAQKGRMENDKGIQNGSMLQQETEDATPDSTREKKSHQSMFSADNQTNLPIEKDHARISKEQRNSTSQAKCHAKSRKHDGSIDGRTSTNPTDVGNPVQSFPVRPQVSNESAYGTPSVDQFRVAVRKVPRKRYEQVNYKSKKDISKRGTGSIFGDTISESSDEVLNTMSQKAAMENSSSTSAGSGISSAAWDGIDAPDDEDIVSLSQKSDIHSILRGSTSYKKARLKPTELLDDTEVP